MAVHDSGSLRAKECAKKPWWKRARGHTDLLLSSDCLVLANYCSTLLKYGNSVGWTPLGKIIQIPLLFSSWSIYYKNGKISIDCRIASLRKPKSLL